MKNLTWQNPGQLFVAQELIKIVKLKCCGIKALLVFEPNFDGNPGAVMSVCKLVDGK